MVRHDKVLVRWFFGLLTDNSCHYMAEAARDFFWATFIRPLLPFIHDGLTLIITLPPKGNYKGAGMIAQ